MRTLTPCLISLALLLAATAVAKADTLLLEGIEASRAEEQPRPSRGMSMQAVEQRFGSPQNRQPAVGEPPITRWEYAGFIVYFEHSHVIHAALKRDPA